MAESTKRTFWEAIEFRWSILNLFLGVPAAFASFALPAWAVRSMRTLENLGPGIWVLAGFVGLLLFCCAIFLLALSRRWLVRSGYDARLALRSGSVIDPMAKTFERKRIYMGDFVLPSMPLVDGKTFIECEIVGPVNFLLDYGNRVDDPRYPIADAIVIGDAVSPWNAIVFRNCMFRSCSFPRVTFLVRHREYESAKNLGWLNWLSLVPGEIAQAELELPPILPRAEQRPGSQNADNQTEV